MFASGIQFILLYEEGIQQMVPKALFNPMNVWFCLYTRFERQIYMLRGLELSLKLYSTTMKFHVGPLPYSVLWILSTSADLRERIKWLLHGSKRLRDTERPSVNGRKKMYDVSSVDLGFRKAKFTPISVGPFTNFNTYLFLRRCILSKCKRFVDLFTKSLPLLQLHLRYAVEEKFKRGIFRG